MKIKQLRFIGYFLTIVITAILILGMAACSSSVTTANTPTTTTAPVTTATGTTAPTLSSIVVTPASPVANVEVGSTQQFTATGNYSDGSTTDISSKVTWTSSDTTVATIDSNGVATGIAVGNTNITASLSGVTSPAVTLTVMVPIPPLSSIAITPVSPDNSTNLKIGSTQRFIATGTYSDGSTANISSVVSWTSSDTAVATIDSDGLATGVAAGNTNITAARSGVTSPAVTLTVVSSTK